LEFFWIVTVKQFRFTDFGSFVGLSPERLGKSGERFGDGGSIFIFIVSIVVAVLRTRVRRFFWIFGVQFIVVRRSITITRWWGRRRRIVGGNSMNACSSSEWD